MVVGLQGLAGTVRFLSGNTTGSVVPVRGGSCVAPLPILVSLTVSVPLPLALGQRAERPLLPHPFHAAGMLGIQLPPLCYWHSTEAFTTGLFHFLSAPPSCSLWAMILVLWLISSRNPSSSLLNPCRSFLQSIRLSTCCTWGEKNERRGKVARSSDNTNPTASSSKPHTYLVLTAPPQRSLHTSETSPMNTWLLLLNNFLFVVLRG